MDIIEIKFSEAPTFKEQEYKDTWVKYGEDNDFPEVLINLSNTSSLHNAIISSKVDAVKGKGLTYENKDTEPDIKTDAFIQNANPYETLDDILFKCAYDLTLFGGYCLEIVMNKERTKIAELYHIDFSKVRSGVADSRGIIKKYYYSKDWCNWKRTGFKPTPIIAYSKDNTASNQYIYYREYRPSIQYYPLPSYVGSLKYIECDVEISNFYLNNIKNGMAPSMMINFNNGVPTDEERDVIVRQIKDTKTGSNNAGNIIVNFSNSKDQAPELTMMAPSDLDKQFVQLNATVLQNILSGHRIVSPLLVGIKENTGFGSNAQEMESAWNLFMTQTIKPLQEQLLLNFNSIMSFNKLKELKIEQNDPIAFSWSESVLTTIMTPDEQREKIGLEPLQNTNVPQEPQNNINTNG